MKYDVESDIRDSERDDGIVATEASKIAWLSSEIADLAMIRPRLAEWDADAVAAADHYVEIFSRRRAKARRRLAERLALLRERAARSARGARGQALRSGRKRSRWEKGDLAMNSEMARYLARADAMAGSARVCVGGVWEAARAAPRGRRGNPGELEEGDAAGDPVVRETRAWVNRLLSTPGALHAAVVETAALRRVDSEKFCDLALKSGDEDLDRRATAARLVVVATSSRASVAYAARAVAALGGGGAFRRIFVIANERDGRMSDRDIEGFARAGAKCVRVSACEADGLRRYAAAGLTPWRGQFVIEAEGLKKGNETLASVLGLKTVAGPGLDSSAVVYWTVTRAVFKWSEATLVRLAEDGVFDDVERGAGRFRAGRMSPGRAAASSGNAAMRGRNSGQ